MYCTTIIIDVWYLTEYFKGSSVLEGGYWEKGNS